VPNTRGNGNAPPGPASRDRASSGRDARVRHIGVVHDEYAVSPDGMKAFGVLDLETEMGRVPIFIGLRNSHDKSMRLAMTCGYRVFVCSNMAFAGDFTPVLAKHSKSFSLIDCISVGVDRMQRNFEPMRNRWKPGREVN